MTKIDVNQENSSRQPHEVPKSSIGKNHQSSIRIILLNEVKTQGKGFAIPIMGLGLLLVASV